MKHDRIVMLAQLLFLLVFVVLLFACQPHMTYDELEEGAKTSPEIEKRLERFERDAERAGAFLEQRWVCESSGECYTFCDWHGPRWNVDRTEFEDLDDMVRWYRHIKHSCSFVNRMSEW